MPKLCLVLMLGLLGVSQSWADEPIQENPILVASNKAMRILNVAIDNPAILHTDVGATLLRIRAHLPEQRYRVVIPGSWEEGAKCNRQSTAVGMANVAAFVSTGTCITTFGSGQAWSRCEITFCPYFENSGPEFLVHLILHEVAHTTGIMNECQASYAAMMAERLAGVPAVSDGYTARCGLTPLLSTEN